MTHAHHPEGLQQAIDIIDTCLANAAYATCTVIHHTLDISPGALIFQQDMILNIPLIADIEISSAKTTSFDQWMTLMSSFETKVNGLSTRTSFTHC